MKELLGFLAVWSIVLSGLALVTGVVLIKKGNRVAHHRAMLTATSLALLFLVFYLAKWALHGTTAYGGPEVEGCCRGAGGVGRDASGKVSPPYTDAYT